MLKYQSLQLHLEQSTQDETELSFGRFGELVGGLPPSAYKYQPWWANDRTHVQAKAWLGAGWEVVNVDFPRRRVRFRRRRDSG